MALIVHKRADGSLVIDPRSPVPDQHPLNVATLDRWGVIPGKPVTLGTADGDVTYTLSGYGTRIAKGKEVTDYKVMIYQREPADA